MITNETLLMFDLDGTISDPLEGIAKSINYALSFFGLEEISPPDLGKYIGPPLEESFKEITGVCDDTEVAPFISKYRERYAEVGFSENRLYPGIKAALNDLSGRNIPLAVCTSKRRDFAEKILKMFGMLHLFKFVCGGDVGIRKWQQIESLISSGRVDGSCIMIGDRDVDLVAAHRNGVRSMGVLWGYGSRAELEKHSPVCLLNQPSDLLNLSGCP